MKSAFVMAAILALYASQSASFPQRNNTEYGSRRLLGGQLIHRLLQYPIGVLKIVLSDESRKEDVLPVFQPPQKEENPVTEVDTWVTEEAPVTEEEGEWQVLELNETNPLLFKSLISVPARCKDNEGLVGGRCRQIVSGN